MSSLTFNLSRAVGPVLGAAVVAAAASVACLARFGLSARSLVNWALPILGTLAALGFDAKEGGESTGPAPSTWSSTLERVNRAHPELGMTAIDDQWPEERFYFRSDHYNFARKGIPVLFFFNGVHQDYHRVTDSADKIGSEKESRILKLLYYLGLEIGNAPRRPAWDPDSRRLIVSPSPEPSRERVCPLSTCTKGSKISSSLSSGIPTPVSSTRTSTRSRGAVAQVQALGIPAGRIALQCHSMGAASCLLAGGTWTIFKKKEWNGCVTDRDQDYDVKNTGPSRLLERLHQAGRWSGRDGTALSATICTRIRLSSATSDGMRSGSRPRARSDSRRAARSGPRSCRRSPVRRRSIRATASSAVVA